MNLAPVAAITGCFAWTELLHTQLRPPTPGAQVGLMSIDPGAAVHVEIVIHPTTARLLSLPEPLLLEVLQTAGAFEPTGGDTMPHILSDLLC
ncbi:hypothetical protein WJX72_000668 [[Myrmecia] bisecta]|uniref:Uncharacterized protein n=1 Tax=[Myrmecia] bisecta TaxID=41462 RepID=A0AAW1Q4V9_9CHLO